jgi:hypothetical protein
MSAPSDDSMADDRVPTTSSEPRHKDQYTPEELKSRGVANVDAHTTDAIIIKTWGHFQTCLHRHLTDGFEMT